MASASVPRCSWITWLAILSQLITIAGTMAGTGAVLLYVIESRVAAFMFQLVYLYLVPGSNNRETGG